MSKRTLKLYVGNIPFATTQDELRVAFEGFGFQVMEAKVILDRDTQKSRGFGFVTIVAGDDDTGETIARDLLDRSVAIDGRAPTVSEARKQEDRARGGGGSGGGRGNRGNRDGGRGGRGGQNRRGGGGGEFWDK